MKKLSLIIMLFAAILVCGCGNPTPQEVQEGKEPKVVEMAGDPLKMIEDDAIRATEVQLVEQMVSYRNNYLEQLAKLGKFYDRQGNQMKAVWVKKEMDSLAKIDMRPYIVIAEITGPNLVAAEAIAEADKMYAEATELITDSRGVFRDLKGLLAAKKKLEELIATYPASDKIDDAAWQIAEIYNRDLGDFYVAMFYYQRVWQWNVDNPYSARFAVAKIYDEQFHNYTRACEFYEKAIKLESAYTANVTSATNRIKALNSK